MCIFWSPYLCSIRKNSNSIIFLQFYLFLTWYFRNLEKEKRAISHSFRLWQLRRSAQSILITRKTRSSSSSQIVSSNSRSTCEDYAAYLSSYIIFSASAIDEVSGASDAHIWDEFPESNHRNLELFIRYAFIIDAICAKSA